MRVHVKGSFVATNAPHHPSIHPSTHPSIHPPTSLSATSPSIDIGFTLVYLRFIFLPTDRWTCKCAHRARQNRGPLLSHTHQTPTQLTG